MSRVMLITGGSRGIGAACARRAAAVGYDVCINFVRDRAAAESVVESCLRLGSKAAAIQADVADEAAVVRLFDQTEAELGPLRVLVHSAGVVAEQAPLAEFSAARIRRVLEINVLGAFLCAREAVRRMSTLRGGSGGNIVNLSSRAASLGSPHEYIDYAASKGAIDTLTIGLGKEVAKEGIRVNAVRPGLIDTEIHGSAGDPGRVERLAPGVPLGRGGTADEVAGLVLWLASDEASYVTAALFDCGGGR